MKNLLITLGIFLGIIIIGLIALSLAIGFGMKRATEPKVSLESYEGIISKKTENSSLYSFLPAKIPVEAEDAAFYHIRGFLQGGDIISLRIRLPQDIVGRLLVEMEESGRTEAGRNEINKISTYCYPKFGIEDASDDALFDNLASLPKGFRIFLYKSDLKSIEENWNHNFLAFTAISLDRSEVVYHVDNW